MRHSLLIFTEGRKTEPIYLGHWHRLHRERVIVTIDDFHGTPLQLVEQAVEQRVSDKREERRGRGAAYSDYWCVFDIDEHPHIQRALELAATNGINAAVSNPCIELWFLLHFHDQRAALDRAEAQHKSCALLGNGKVPTTKALAELVNRYEGARDRAKALDSKHELDGSPPGANPSSRAWQLIDQIRRLG